MDHFFILRKNSLLAHFLAKDFPLLSFYLMPRASIAFANGDDKNQIQASSTARGSYPLSPLSADQSAADYQLTIYDERVLTAWP